MNQHRDNDGTTWPCDLGFVHGREVASQKQPRARIEGLVHELSDGRITVIEPKQVAQFVPNDR